MSIRSQPPRRSAAPPAKGGSAAPHVPAPGREPAVELRLAIGRQGLGLELARPAGLGCVTVTDLAVTLPTARFPIDVSGGVSRFRHRRGQLQSVAIEVDARTLEKWAAPRLRGLVSSDAPDVWVLVRKGGATIALIARENALDPASSPRILAFDLALLVDGDDIVLGVAHARGSGLAAPATALAIAATVAALGDGVAVRRGAELRISRASERIARALLPEAGARAPDASGMRWTAVAATGDTWLMHGAAHGASADADEDALRAHESNALTLDADDALVANDLPRARELDLAALERAPRHPEISRRIAEIDQLYGGRAEAALGTLVDAHRSHENRDAMLAAELLAETGDTEAAIAAFARTGDAEPVPALGARAFERAAELTANPHEALDWLDRGLARAPRTARVRWSRMRGRLAAGRLADALSDVEHLEAQAKAREKHFVWRRAGEAWALAGHKWEAATLFERALRYAPDAPEALAGIGAALVAGGRATRGVAILTRAIDLAERAGTPLHATSLDLARALADDLDDLPAAIARVRQIPDAAREALEARGTEGRWRAQLGDLAGAAFAFARLRDLAETRVEHGSAGAVRDLVTDLLLEAASFEQSERGDLFAAQRHLACAIRLRPHDVAVQRAYREVGAAIAGPTPREPAEEPATAHEPAPSRDSLPACRLDLAFEPDQLSSLDDEEEARAAARVEELTRKLQGDPTRDEVADELALLLEKLGRSHELLALLSARLEDATPERRPALLAISRATASRLATEARSAGRESDAQLYGDALAMIFK